MFSLFPFSERFKFCSSFFYACLLRLSCALLKSLLFKFSLRQFVTRLGWCIAITFRLKFIEEWTCNMLDRQNCVLNDCLILEWDSVFLRAFHNSYHNLALIILAIFV